MGPMTAAGAVAYGTFLAAVGFWAVLTFTRGRR